MKFKRQIKDDKVKLLDVLTSSLTWHFENIFYKKFSEEWRRFKKGKTLGFGEIWRKEMLSRNPDRIQKKFLVLRYFLIQL